MDSIQERAASTKSEPQTNQTVQDRADALAKLVVDLHANLDEPIFFGKLSAYLREEFIAEGVEIFQSFQDGAIQLVAKNGEAVISGEVVERPAGVVGHVCRTKRAYYSNAVKRDPLFSQDRVDNGADAVLCVPINSQGTLLGAIQLSFQGEQRGYSEEDISKVLKILNCIERPLNNMRMYLLAKHLNRELSKKIELKEKELSDKHDLSSKSRLAMRPESVGRDPQMIRIMEMTKKVAAENFPLLLQGEVGTGRKHFAREIHFLSERASGPCIVAHCDALATHILEEELFGSSRKKGLVELANGGTLILSEIHELETPLQSKLLQLISSGEFRKVGDHQLTKVDIRIFGHDKNRFRVKGKR